MKLFSSATLLTYTFLSFLTASMLAHGSNANQTVQQISKSAKTLDLLLDMEEFAYNQPDGSVTKWQNVPIKLLSYPLTKIQYDVLQTAFATAEESATRSPIHNLLGTIDEAKHSSHLFEMGFLDIIKGLFNPKRAGLFDGAFELADGSINVVTGVVSGAIKTAASIIAYPIHRILGGDASVRAPIAGKRAAIVLINTDYGVPIDPIVDQYGESMVHYMLKGVADYYCVESYNEGDATECANRIPDGIESVDFISMTHSGGTYRMEGLAKKITDRGMNVGLMLSIGCYDSPSSMTSSENSMGQQGISWAVHFYLVEAISKRLRGIPIQQAAQEAFNESLPLNFLNPISIAGQLFVVGWEADGALMPGQYFTGKDIESSQPRFLPGPIQNSIPHNYLVGKNATAPSVSLQAATNANSYVNIRMAMSYAGTISEPQTVRLFGHRKAKARRTLDMQVENQDQRLISISKYDKLGRECGYSGVADLKDNKLISTTDFKRPDGSIAKCVITIADKGSYYEVEDENNVCSADLNFCGPNETISGRWTKQ